MPSCRNPSGCWQAAFTKHGGASGVIGDHVGGARHGHRANPSKGKTFHMILYRLLLIYTSPSMPEGGMTRCEVAGIHIEGSNKWKTIIQAAAKQKSDD